MKRDAIARTVIGRLTVADVDLWHARLRGKGVGESSIRNQHLVMRASMSRAARWGWVATNVVALATLGRRKTPPRSAMAADDVRAVIAAGEALDPAAGLAFRLAAISPHWRLHDLRHWSATQAIGRGHDIRTVAGRLGHANPAMTLRTYAHAIDGADAGVAATLAESLDGES